MLRPLLNIHPPQPDADGARRDDDDLVAILPQLHSRFHYRRQDGEEGLMTLFVDDGARAWDYFVSDMSPCLSNGYYSPSLMTTPSGRGPLMAARCLRPKVSNKDGKTG